MFGTLRYEPQEDVEYYQAGGYSSAPQRAACDTCRARKLRCSGQKNGCNRCKSSSTKCVYSKTATGSRPGGKQTTANRPGDKSRSISDSSRSSTGSRTSAPPSSTPAEALEPSTTATTGPERGNGVQILQTPPGDDICLDSFASPDQSLQDDCTVSDDIFQDLMSLGHLSPQNFDEDMSFLNNPDPMTLDSHDYYPVDLVRTPEDRNMISSGNYAGNVSDRYTWVPDPVTDAVSSPAMTARMQVDRLQSQRQLHDNNFLRRPSASEQNTLPDIMSIRQTQTSQQRQDREDHQSPSEDRDYPPKAICPRRSCRCLQNIVHLLDELETRVCMTEPQAIDSVLAYQKECLAHCSHMVQCATCSRRSEHMTLLGLVTDKLLTSYGHFIARHLTSVPRPDDQVARKDRKDTKASSPSSLPVTTAFPASEPSVTDGSGPSSRAITFGCYRINRATELEHVGRALFTLQLRQMHALLTRMQSISEITLRGQQAPALKSRERRLRNMLDSVHHLVRS